MLFPNLADVKQVLTTHHIANLLLSVSFFVSKTTPVCSWIFPEGYSQCEIESREREILMFLLVIVMWKGRKTTNWLHYMSNVFLFSKVANIFLFIRADVVAGVVYIAFCLLVTVLFPEPVFSGPEEVTYFQGEQLFEQLKNDKKSVWVIQFFTTWSPECKHVTPVFAKLSQKFTLPHLKFGKLDIGRFPKEGERFRVNSHPMSRQLPTVCVFKDAKEIARRPLVNENRRAVPFVFSEDNCTVAFNLLNLHNEQSKIKSGKSDKKNDSSQTGHLNGEGSDNF